MKDMGKLVYKKKVCPIKIAFFGYLLLSLLLVITIPLGIYYSFMFMDIPLLAMSFIFIPFAYGSILLTIRTYKLSSLWIYEKGIVSPFFYNMKDQDKRNYFIYTEIKKIYINGLANLEIITNNDKFEIELRYPNLDRTEILQRIITVKNNFYQREN